MFASRWRRASSPGSEMLFEVLHQPRHDDARRDGVDTHSERAAVHGGRLRQADHAVLGGDVRNDRIASHQARERRGRDDGAAGTLLGELPETVAQPEEDSSEVDRDDLVEVVSRDLGEWREGSGNPGIDVEEVDTPERIEGRLHVGGDVLLLRDISPHRDRRSWKRLRDSPRGVFVPVDDDQLGAVLGIAAARRPPRSRFRLR